VGFGIEASVLRAHTTARQEAQARATAQAKADAAKKAGAGVKTAYTQAAGAGKPPPTSGAIK